MEESIPLLPRASATFTWIVWNLLAGGEDRHSARAPGSKGWVGGGF